MKEYCKTLQEAVVKGVTDLDLKVLKKDMLKEVQLKYLFFDNILQIRILLCNITSVICCDISFSELSP